MPASYTEGVNPHEYNAHFIDAYFTPKLFVVADGPQERNAGKFWQMVWDQDCSYVIMLTPYDDKVRVQSSGITMFFAACCTVYAVCITFH